MKLKMMLLKPTDKTLSLNIKQDELVKPVQGPSNPFNGVKKELKNVLTGYAEPEAMSDVAFRNQHRTYQAYGYARDPANLVGSAEIFIGDLEQAKINNGADILSRRLPRSEREKIRGTREAKGDVTVLDGDDAYKGPWAKYKSDKAAEEVSENEADYQQAEEEMGGSDEVLEPIYNIEAGELFETTEWHQESMVDYAGRSRVYHVPQDLDINLLKEPGKQECFVPKRIIHTWEGHNQALSALRFFPQSGHLFLSGGMDNVIKLWDFYHGRELLRSYKGHTKAIKDLAFASDGHQFISSSFDRMVKLWDTESGVCSHRIDIGATGNAVKFHPDKPNEFLVATSNKKIIQYDLRTGESVQQYDHHLSAVNTITFIDENRRFITTSDDKSIRGWDYGVNIPVKIIHEPYLHSVVSVAAHPSGKYLAGQSLDNSIMIITVGDRIRLKGSGFRGHNCAGFPVQIDISPDGKYCMSGDSGGYACFWDWKTKKLLSKLPVHKGCMTCIAAHPQESSKVLTGGWDGLIRVLD